MEERASCVSWFEGTVHQSRIEAAETLGDWSHRFCSQEAESEGKAGAQLAFYSETHSPKMVRATFKVNLLSSVKPS